MADTSGTPRAGAGVETAAAKSVSALLLQPGHGRNEIARRARADRTKRGLADYRCRIDKADAALAASREEAEQLRSELAQREAELAHARSRFSEAKSLIERMQRLGF